jgi:murein DD-endopeptidase MepM/ murein hydrolase activator NlpD
MTCSFPKGEQMSNITVYGCFSSPSENISVKMGVEKVEGVSNTEDNSTKNKGQSTTANGVCECEPKIRAFMRVIRIAEGTGEYVKGSKQVRDPQLGYTTWFSGSGNNFVLSDDHPRVINSNSTNTLRSSAAGAYQIMSWKYDELNGYTIEFKDGYFQKKSPEEYIEKKDKAKKYNAKGFLQESQDRLCVIILKDIGTITKLLNKDIRGAIASAAGTWVSLPGGTTGQPTAKMQETLDYYDEFLKEELSGKSHLHIQKGFLADFGIKCNCGNESNSAWHNPLAKMELRGWYSDTQWSPGKSDFHGRSGGKHDGLDLYAPVGTTVYACIDGTITFASDPTGYGNRTFLEGDYNGQKYFLMYAHLSEYNIGEVKAGDTIGKTGQTGNANGLAAKMAHLHFEVRKEKMSKPSFNPLTEIPELGTAVNTSPNQDTQI